MFYDDLKKCFKDSYDSMACEVNIIPKNDISMNNKTAACGKNHSVVIKEDGRVFAFGDNTHGQFGKVHNEKIK